jgi:hypothetical protein
MTHSGLQDKWLRLAKASFARTFSTSIRRTAQESNMKRKIFVLCVALLAALGLNPMGVWAFGIVDLNSTTSAFQDFGTAPDANSGSPNLGPYWDRTSSDGFAANVGYYVTTSGFFYNDPQVGAVNGLGWAKEASQYFGTGTGTGLSSKQLYLTDGTANFNFNLEIAGNRNVNEIGYFAYDPITKTQIGPDQAIFIGTQTVGAQKLNVDVPDSFGLYLKTAGGTRYDSVTNYGTESHFTIMRNVNNPSTWVIGAEDLSLGDADYNDLVMSVKPVPLPGALLLLGAGLVRLASYARRKRELV